MDWRRTIGGLLKMMVSLIIVKALDELESIEIKLTAYGKLLEEK